MVIMNEEKEVPGSSKDVSKKTCPRAARENAKKKAEAKSWKTAHTGLRFHFDRKKLVTHEFSFNSVSKSEKVTRCRSREKSVEKQSNGESTTTTGTKEIKVLMDTLKISKSEECSNREKSPLRKEMPKSPVVERLTSKKACTRCSRCSRSPKVETSDTKPLKVAKSQDHPPKTVKKENIPVKTVKIEIPGSPKTCKKQCSKLAKVLAEPQEKTIKPKSILIHPEKATGENDKKASKNCEIETPPQSPKTVTCKKQCSKLAKLLAEPREKTSNAKPNPVPTDKSACRDDEKNSASKNCERTASNEEKAKSGKIVCIKEEKIEFAWPNAGKPENVISRSEIPIPDSHNRERSEIPNGSEHPTAPAIVTCVLNGTRHDEHICDPHLGLESPDESRMESMKAPSKIPRKTQGVAGLKPDVNLNREMAPQTLIEL